MAGHKKVDAKGAKNGKKVCKERKVDFIFVKNSALSTQHSALSTQHSALGTRHSALGTQHLAQPFLRPLLDLSASFPETHPSRDRLRIISAAQAQYGEFAWKPITTRTICPNLP